MPPLIDPQVIASLLQNAPQGGQQQGPLPPTNPVQPQAGVPLPGTGMSAQATPQQAAQSPASAGLLTPETTKLIQEQSRMGMGAFKEREQSAMDIANQLQGPGGLIEKQQAQSGNLSFHPNMVQGQGAGGFFHNLGQALLTLGAATAPGQAFQDVYYSKPRQEYAGRAEQIKQLQETEKGVQEGMGSAAQLAYKPYSAESQLAKGQSALSMAQSRADAVINTHNDKLAQIAANKDIAARRIEGEKEIQRMRDDILREVTGMKDVTSEDVARIMSSSAQTIENTKLAADPSWWGEMKRKYFGVQGVQAPGGEQPVSGEAPPPPRTATPDNKKATPKSKNRVIDLTK